MHSDNHDGDQKQESRSVESQNPISPQLRHLLIASANVALRCEIETRVDPGPQARFDCHNVSSLQQALEEVSKHSYDAILFDMQLCENSPQTCLRKILNAANAPIIVLTEEGMDDRSLQYLEAGAQEYLSKDALSTTNLRRAIGYAISRHRANDLGRRLEHSDRLAALGQLTAGVAHEINNPAMYVLSNLRQMEELVQRLIGGEGAHGDLDLLADMVGDCQSGVDLIASISRELKFFARSDDEESVERIDVKELITNSSNMTLNEIRYRAEFEQKIAAVPPIVGSRSKLSQVLINILINAAHSIESGDSANNKICIAANQEAGALVIRISDTGTGIAPEAIEKIFEPYYTTKTHGLGTGLGLPICREIIQQHRGQIEVQSTLGKGTTFTIRLPVESGISVPKRVKRQTTGSLSNKRHRVLLIDDEPLLLKSLARMLGSHHSVSSAAGGAKALSLLEEDSKFDAIICDLMMPEVDGLHVYNTLRDNYPELLPRLIYLSGGVFTSRMSDFLGQIRPTLLDKPVSRDALLEAIDAVLNQNKS